jgi:hypothetical protein
MTNFIELYLSPVLPLADLLAGAGLDAGLAFVLSLTLTLCWPAFILHSVLTLCERRAFRRFAGGDK